MWGCLPPMFKVQGPRYKVQVSRFKVQGLRLKVQGSRFKVQGSRFKIQGLSLFNFRMVQFYINPEDLPGKEFSITERFNRNYTFIIWNMENWILNVKYWISNIMLHLYMLSWRGDVLLRERLDFELKEDYSFRFDILLFQSLCPFVPLSLHPFWKTHTKRVFLVVEPLRSG